MLCHTQETINQLRGLIFLAISANPRGIWKLKLLMHLSSFYWQNPSLFLSLLTDLVEAGLIADMNGYFYPLADNELIQSLDTGTLPYRIVRSNRKSLNMRFDFNGTLIIQAPKTATGSEISDFASTDSVQSWIKNTYLNLVVQKQKYSPLTSTETGNIILFQGEQYTLVQDYTDSIYFRDGSLFVPVYCSLDTLRSWLASQAEQVLTDRVKFWSDRMGLVPSSISFSRSPDDGGWASCGSDDDLNFVWQLILCPPEIQDYTVIHELSHIQHFDHSRAFWKLVKQYCPAYKDCLNWLAENPLILKFL